MKKLPANDKIQLYVMTLYNCLVAHLEFGYSQKKIISKHYF